MTCGRAGQADQNEQQWQHSRVLTFDETTRKIGSVLGPDGWLSPTQLLQHPLFTDVDRDRSWTAPVEAIVEGSDGEGGGGNFGRRTLPRTHTKRLRGATSGCTTDFSRRTLARTKVVSKKDWQAQMSAARAKSTNLVVESVDQTQLQLMGGDSDDDWDEPDLMQRVASRSLTHEFKAFDPVSLRSSANFGADDWGADTHIDFDNDFDDDDADDPPAPPLAPPPAPPEVWPVAECKSSLRRLTQESAPTQLEAKAAPAMAAPAMARPSRSSTDDDWGVDELVAVEADGDWD